MQVPKDVPRIHAGLRTGTRNEQERSQTGTRAKKIINKNLDCGVLSSNPEVRQNFLRVKCREFWNW